MPIFPGFGYGAYGTPPVGPTRAPVQQTGGGFFDSLLDDRGNPEGLGMLGVGLMGQNSQLGQAIQQGLKMRAFNDQRSALAKYLVRKGIAQDEQEGFALASDPDLLNKMAKDNSLVDQFHQRQQIANELGLSGEQANRFSAAGTWDDQTGGAGGSSLNDYQKYQLAQKDPAFAKFLRESKGREGGLMAGDRQAVREWDDMAIASGNTIQVLNGILAPGPNGLSLNQRAGSGDLAKTQAWLARNDPTGMFDSEQGRATTELENTILNNALGSLRAIFGGNPTEGERKVLLDLQASVDKTPEERKTILENAIKLAKMRQAQYEDRAASMRGGTYYDNSVGTGLGEGAPDATGLNSGGWTVKVK